MATSIDTIDDFLSQHRLALVGLSRNPKDLSRLVLRALVERGHELVAVNNQGGDVDGIPTFKSLRDVPARPEGPPVDGVIIMVPPTESAGVVAECIALGVQRVWIHRGVGPGSVSAEASRLAREASLVVVDGECPLMFVGSGAHAAHGTLRRLANAYPTGGTRRAPLAVRIALTLLQLFIGAAALAAGALLIAEPSGRGLGMTTALLEHSPFADFFVPGLVLFTINGLGQLACAALVLRARPRAARTSLLFAGALCGWIIFQVSWLSELSWLQPTIFAIGIAQMLLALALVQRVGRASDSTRLAVRIRTT